MGEFIKLKPEDLNLSTINENDPTQLKKQKIEYNEREQARLEANSPTYESIRSIINKLYDDLFENVLPSTDIIKDRFKIDEKNIAEILRSVLGLPDITVEIDSDDPTELYEGDWNYSPYIVVYKDEVELGKFNVYDVRTMESFLNKQE